VSEYGLTASINRLWGGASLRSEVFPVRHLHSHSPSVLWHCWLVNKKGIRPVKKLGVGLLAVTIWLELCTTY